MPTNERTDKTQTGKPSRMQKTKYPGVFSRESTDTPDGKPELVFYVRYRRDGKQVFEKTGGNRRDGMTAAKANFIRAERITGKELPNTERREVDKRRRDKLTISGIWEAYKAARPDVKGKIGRAHV